MVNLQVGHHVRVKSPEPEWRHVNPDFIYLMDKYVGQVFEIAKLEDTFNGDKIVRLEGAPQISHYQWRFEWLELVTNPIRNGDLL